MNAWKISGHHAIRIAERDGVTLYKAADPTEGFRDGLSVEEADRVAAWDPGLVYCIVEPTGWTGDPDGLQVCDYFRGSLNGHARSGATYLGPDDTGNEPTWRDAVLRATHTPGPWAVFVPGNGSCYEGGDAPATIRAGGIYVAAMPGSRAGGISFGKAVRANANLIAAAPELLGALEVALGWLEAARDEEPEDCDNHGLDAAIEQARATIAKAKGI